MLKLFVIVIVIGLSDKYDSKPNIQTQNLINDKFMQKLALTNKEWEKIVSVKV